MTLLAVRDKCLTLSGRYDLGTPTALGTPADNGMNWFINAAQRLLDGLQDTAKSVARYQVDIAAGVRFKELLYCRALLEVSVTNATDGFLPLQRLSASAIKQLYNQDINTSNPNGAPRFWAPAVIGLSPQQVTLTSGNYTSEFAYNAYDLSFGEHYQKRGVLIYPIPDQTYTLTVEGSFFTRELSDDADKSYWTEVVPEILVFATLATIEQSYNNKEGSRDWLEAVKLRLAGVDQGVIYEESHNVRAFQ